MEFAFSVAKLAILAKNCYPLTADSMLYRQIEQARHGKKTIEFCQDKAGQSLEIPASQKSLPDILQDTEESD